MGAVPLTSQNLHQELARAHAALLVDSTNSSLPTPESYLEPSALALADPHPETYKDNSDIFQVGERTASPKQLSAPGKLKRGLTTYGRLEKVDKEKGSKSIEKGVKDIWEFDQSTQDNLVTKSAKHAGSTIVSIKSKQQNTVEAKEGDGVYSDDCNENWREKKGRKQSKTVASRRVKRSKTSGGVSLDDYGILGAEPFKIDAEDDEDYNPVGNRRVRKRVMIDPIPSNERKKTRSNTNEWELMPALPKGRRATVLKQLEAGFVFEGGESSNRESLVVEPLPQDNLSVLSPFKVDLAKNSLSLPEEEKGKYAIFSPTATPNILEQSLEPSALHPLPAVPSQEPFDLTAEVGDINATFPHLPYRGVLATGMTGSYIENTQLILESLSVPSQSLAVQRSLVSRRKTLAQVLDTDSDFSQVETPSGARFSEPAEAPIHSPTFPRRARLKQSRARTAITLSREHSPAPRVERSRIVAASDDESPLSDLDEGEMHPPTSALDISTSTPPRRLRKLKPMSPQLNKNPMLALPPESSNLAAGCGIENQLHESDHQELGCVVAGSNTRSVPAGGRKRPKGNPETPDQGNTRGDASSCPISAHGDSLSDRGDYDATIQSGVGTNHMAHLVNEEDKATQKEVTPPSTPPKANPKQLEHTKPSGGKGPHSPINGGKPPSIKFRVGLSRKANIESLHSYLRK